MTGYLAPTKKVRVADLKQKKRDGEKWAMLTAYDYSTARVFAAAEEASKKAGDAFVTAPLADPMRERFPGALSADMETTATARTAGALGVPFVALRAVSDLCGPAAGQQFHLEIDVVAETSARAVERLAADLAG